MKSVRRSSSGFAAAFLLLAAQSPTVLSKGAYIQINRYLLAGRSEALASVEAPGIVAWRQTRTPGGLILDVKVVGSNLKKAGDGVRRSDAEVAKFAPGGVQRTVLSAMRSLASYRARYRDGWPDDGPR